MSTITLVDPRIREFSNLIAAGLEAWIKAGKLLCRITADNPHAYGEILADNPNLTAEVLTAFERIGRRQLHPYLAMDGSPASKRLALLPYDEQGRLYREKVCVVTTQGAERQKRVCDLTKNEALRVIGEDGIRSKEEQRKLLKAAGRRQRRENTHDPDATEMELPDVETDPVGALSWWLAAAQNALIEARGALTQVHRRESKQDRHITAALQSIGHARLAVSEGQITRDSGLERHITLAGKAIGNLRAAASAGDL